MEAAFELPSCPQIHPRHSFEWSQLDILWAEDHWQFPMASLQCRTGQTWLTHMAMEIHMLLVLGLSLWGLCGKVKPQRLGILLPPLPIIPAPPLNPWCCSAIVPTICRHLRRPHTSSETINELMATNYFSLWAPSPLRQFDVISL